MGDQEFDLLDSSLHEQRSTLRDIWAAIQFPVSGVLRCPSWQTDVPVELINYHYRGACVRLVGDTPLPHGDPEHQDVVFDFYLGHQCLKTGIPIRIAWNALTTDRMLGIEFLSTANDYVERAERYLCHQHIAPHLTSPDPLDVHRHLYFKVIDLSQAGMLLSTSLTNKHLFPGMTLDNAQLVVPGADPLSLCFTIQNVREALDDGYLHVGVTVGMTGKDYERLVSGYLGAMSPNFLQIEPRDASLPSSKIRGKRLKQGLTFRVISTPPEYRQVLRLRHQGYGAKGKLSPAATVERQGEGLSQEGTILGAFLAGKLVASMELRFGDGALSFRTFRIIPREQLASVNPAQTVEVNRLVIHPDVQGTDVVMGMVQKAHAIVMAHGGKDILFVATDTLLPLYRRVGCIELGARVPHPMLKDEYLNAMMLKKETFLAGRFLNPGTWGQLYQATNAYFQKIFGDLHPTASPDAVRGQH